MDLVGTFHFQDSCFGGLVTLAVAMYSNISAHHSDNACLCFDAPLSCAELTGGNQGCEMWSSYQYLASCCFPCVAVELAVILKKLWWVQYSVSFDLLEPCTDHAWLQHQ